jgi:thiol-disulfide isomerase/thioredoxin
MTALMELGSAQAVQDLIDNNANVVITFSATWCGPCKQSKPALEKLAEAYAANAEMDVKFGIVYESDLGDDIQVYAVKAFPTYVLFQQQTEVNRVQGANLPALQAMIEAAGCENDGAGAGGMTGGETLGGTSLSNLTPAEAREARLAKLGAPPPAPAPAADMTPIADMTHVADTSMEDTAADAAAATGDVDMKDANDGDEAPAAAAFNDPTANLNPNDIKILTESMGFILIKAQKGLVFGNGGTVEGAVEWLLEHQDDMDIEEPIPPGAGMVAQSYKCNECGKIMSNMGVLEMHANKTGHSDFEESTELVKPLSPEEKAVKMAEIKELLQKKRAEREETEKVDEVKNEIERRSAGKEMKKTREQLDMEQRKRDAQLRKREKDSVARERIRIRAELAKDKAKRMANNGKLGSRLGVDGYNPDAIQYDVGDKEDEQPQEKKPKKAPADAAKIDEYIKTVSGYKAGGGTYFHCCAHVSLF